MTDIEKIRRILTSRKRSDLADMLVRSEGELYESSTYGTYLFSTLSTYYIKSPPDDNDKLVKLSQIDKQIIKEAVLGVYPPKERSPEVQDVVYTISFDNEYDVVGSDELNTLSMDIIQLQIQKCKDRIAAEDYDGAVTAAKSLVESVCKYILNERSVTYKEGSRKDDLFGLVAKELKMSPGMYKDNESFQKILSGFHNIVKGISEVRNHMGDAHGQNPHQVYRIDKRHAILVVNASMTICEYLYLSFSK